MDSGSRWRKAAAGFSSVKKANVFSGRISQQLNKVFALGLEAILLHDLVKQVEVDFVVVNLFSDRAWEISVTRERKR